ncbi:MAG: 2-oxoglutarate dehydrogenase E1 component, partial [Calditrichaeota bacterium]|nr:2-oxoglutarate dehydrogenase E1 component [Calditrichota bacterium]
MDKFSYINNANGAFIEEQYNRYKESPDSVDEGWRKFFEGYDFAIQTSQNGKMVNGDQPVSIKEVNVVKLINAYRTRGHLIADTNPIRERRKHPVDLGLEYFDLSEADLDREFHVGKEIDLGQSNLRQILERLK